MAEQPRVLIVCFTTVFGGAEVRVMQTARALHALGWTYGVAVLNESRLHVALAAEDLNAVPIGSHRADPRILPGLLRAAKRMEATCIDSHNMQSQYWASLAAVFLPSIRRVVTVHSVYRECYPKQPKLTIHEGALRFGRRVGSEFIAVSETVAADLSRLGIPGNRVSICENGIEPLKEKPVPSPLFEDLGWGAEAFVIAIVGRLEPVKGHEFLFDAVARLARQGETQARILVVGEGNDRTSLEERTEVLGIADRVHFTGFRSDVPNLIARADLLCMPSLTEGLPYTALEAAQQSVPLLLSRVGGPAKVFTHDVTAHFVPPADPEALMQAISELLAAPETRSRLAEAALDLVETRFSVDRMIEETLAVYSD